MKSKRIRNSMIAIVVSIVVIIVGIFIYFLIPKERSFSQLTYVALGDSITYGFDSNDYGNQMAKPYPQLVKENLRLKQVYNYGISGSTLTSVEMSRNPMSIRYQNMIDDADIVSVMGGINDYLIGDAEMGTINDNVSTTIYGSLNILAKGLKEKYPSAYIFFMTPYKCGYDKGTNSKGYSLNDVCLAIKEVCAKYSIDVLDLYTYGNIEVDFDNPNSDKLHPSQNFFKNYTAPQISEFIKENYK